MRKRQITAVLLAAVCATTMAVSAFAAGEEITLAPTETVPDLDADNIPSYELNVDNEVQKPTLKVTLPQSAYVLVNPYRIEITVDTGVTSFDTILSPEMEIINNSGCAIKVGVKGMIQTYLSVDTTTGYEAINSAEYDIVGVPTGVTEADIKCDSATKKIIVDTASGNQLAATVVAPRKATDGTVTTKGKITITGFAPSKTIKVATAPLKNPDLDTSNSLFIYVEGREDSGTWASAFNAKAIAGVTNTTTGAITKTGMMALSAKETTANILYLGSGSTGYARVTGQASTAPTVSWMNLKDTFKTPFTFVVDAVANEAPKPPVLTTSPFGSQISGLTLAEGKVDYTGLTWASYAGDDRCNVTAPAGTTISVSSDTPAVISWDSTNNRLNALSAGKATITLTLTAKGVSSTYTFEVTTTA